MATTSTTRPAQRSVRIKISLDGKYTTVRGKFYTSTTDKDIEAYIKTVWFPSRDVIVYQIYRY